MLQRALSALSRPLLSSVSPRNRQSPSRSLSSPSQFPSEDAEKLFQYTRGRWLYNEREREYTTFLLISNTVTILRILFEMQKMTYVIHVSILTSWSELRARR
jgi:hypothetical protein